MSETTPGVGGQRRPPLETATAALHSWRGHDRKRSRIGEALSSGGLSLIFDPHCTCQSDATVIISALMDEGYVVLSSDDGEAR